MTTKNDDTKARHAFDHIAPGPYRYVGCFEKVYQACQGAPIQPGGTCDHCAAGIRFCYRVKAADGTEFIVGSSCIEKAGEKGRLPSNVKAEANRIKREAKAERDAARIAAGRELFAANREAFAAAPHPRGFEDRETGEPLTLADQVEWMMINSGTTGRVKTARLIEKFVAAL